MKRLIEGRVRRAVLFVVIAAVTAAGLSSQVLARDWYVTVDGVAGSSATIDEPTSLFSALDRAGPEDTIILRAGRYDLTRQIFLRQPGLTLRGYEGERPRLVMATDNPRLNSVIWFYAERNTIENLDVEGGYWYAVKIEQPHSVIRNCRLGYSGRDTVKIVRTGHGALIERTEIRYSGMRDPSSAEGIDNVSADNVIIRDCYIHNIGANGIYMKGGARNCLIERNIVTDTNAHGIMLGQSSGQEFLTSIYECRDSIARNNIVARTRGSGLVLEAANNCRLYNNTLYDVAREFGGGISVHANAHGTSSKDVYVYNNIIVVKSTRPMFFVHETGLASMADMTCDYNIYYNTTGSYRYSWWPGPQVHFRSFHEWQEGTTFDANSFVADPQFEGGLP